MIPTTLPNFANRKDFSRVQDQPLVSRGFLGSTGFLDQGGGLSSTLLRMNLPADHLAAVDIEDQVELEKLSVDCRG